MSVCLKVVFIISKNSKVLIIISGSLKVFIIILFMFILLLNVIVQCSMFVSIFLIKIVSN